MLASPAVGEPEPADDAVARPGSGTCEEDLVQFELPGGGADLRTEAAAAAAIAVCTARPGCSYVPGDCYCRCRGYGRIAVDDGAEAEGCFCFCANGAPPTCRAAS